MQDWIYPLSLLSFRLHLRCEPAGVNILLHQLEIVSEQDPPARMETALEAGTILSDSGLRVTPCVFKEEEQAACLPLSVAVLCTSQSPDGGRGLLVYIKCLSLSNLEAP